MSSCGDQTKCTMYVLFMLLVNGVAIAMVVIGAINSGRHGQSATFPPKISFGDFLEYKEHFADLYVNRLNSKFLSTVLLYFADFMLFHVYKISRLLSPKY